MQKILREALVHFLFLGACLFWVFNLLNPQSVQNLKTIQVDNDKLLTFLQYRAKQFDVSQFSDFLETLSADKLQRLVNDYTKEEALFREAKSLGLDSNDYVARQRLIQQVTYLIAVLSTLGYP